MLKRTIRIGLINSSEDNIGVMIRKEGERRFYYEPVVVLRGAIWSRTTGWVRASTRRYSFCHQNLCEVDVFREQGIMLSVQESWTPWPQLTTDALKCIQMGGNCSYFLYQSFNSLDYRWCKTVLVKVNTRYIFKEFNHQDSTSYVRYRTNYNNNNELKISSTNETTLICFRRSIWTLVSKRNTIKVFELEKGV